MRRSALLAALAAVLGWGLVAGAGPVGAQTTTIALSFTNTSDTALTAVGEDGGAQTVRVVATASSAVSSAVSVSVTVGASGGTATSGSCSGMPSSCTGDYGVSAASVTVTIASGDTAGSADVTVTPYSDTVTEDHETIRFTGSATGYTVNSADLAITDADRTITLSLNDPVFPETGAASGNNSIDRDKSKVVTGTLSGVTSTYSSAIRIDLALISYTALHPVDYSWDHSFSLKTINIPAGDTSGTVTDFTFRIKDDRVAEPDETFGVTSSVSGFTVAPAVATITDMDSVVALTSSGGLSEGSDGSGVMVSAAFTAPDGTAATSSTHGSSTDVVLSVAAGSSDTASAADFSYSPSTPNTVSIPANTVSSSVSATLAGLSITDDDVVEGSETLSLSGTLSGFTVGSASLAITPSDADVALSVSPGVVAESVSAQTVTATAAFAGSSSALASATEVTVTVAGGMGGSGAVLDAAGDFTTDQVGHTFTVRIPAGAVTGSASFGVTARADGVSEGIETAALSGSAMVGGSAVTVTGAELAIADSLATFAVDDGESPPTEVTSLGEDSGTSELNLTITLPSWVTVPVGGVEARFRVTGGTATLRAGADFGSREDFGVVYPGSPDLSDAYPGVIEIAAGASSATVSFSLEVNDDEEFEGRAGETIRVEGFVPVGGVDLPVSPFELLIVDNDAAAVPPSSPAPVPVPDPARLAGCEGRFCDEDDSAHQASINAIADLGITEGCSSDDPLLFCPHRLVTRSQMAAFLYRAVGHCTGRVPPAARGVELTDVAPDAWYRPFAQWAVARAGFVAPGGEFDSASEVSRSDMATMMAAAFSLLPPDQQPDQPEGIFADMVGQPPAVIAAAEALYRAGITRGCAVDPLRYCPDRPVTRAQMASFIIRALNTAPAPTG